jgi:hypothetical protein
MARLPQQPVEELDLAALGAPHGQMQGAATTAMPAAS